MNAPARLTRSIPIASLVLVAIVSAACVGQAAPRTRTSSAPTASAATAAASTAPTVAPTVAAATAAATAAASASAAASVAASAIAATTPAPSAAAAASAPAASAAAPSAPATSASPAAAPSATVAPAPTQAASTDTGPIAATLFDTSIKLSRSSVASGPVQFSIKNSGTVIHELILLKTDVPQDKIPVDPAKPGMVSEPGLITQTSSLAVGASTSLSLTLPAGNYVLLCNQPAHYLIGMHTAFAAN